MALRAVTPLAGAGCPPDGHPSRESREAAEVGVHHHQAGAGVLRIKGVIIADTLHRRRAHRSLVSEFTTPGRCPGKPPAGLKTAAPKMMEVLTQKRDDLKALITDVRAQIEAARAA